jgi:hypothetical protein
MGIQRSLTAKPKKTHFQDSLKEDIGKKRPNHTTKGFYRNPSGLGEDVYLNTTLSKQGVLEDVDEKNYLEDIKVLTWESFSEDSGDNEKKEEFSKNRKNFGEKLKDIKKEVAREGHSLLSHGKDTLRASSAKTVDILELDIKNLNSTLLSKKEEVKRLEGKALILHFYFFTLNAIIF